MVAGVSYRSVFWVVSINNYCNKSFCRCGRGGFAAMNHPHINHSQFEVTFGNNINRLKINCISLVIYMMRNAIRLISIDRYV